MAMKTRPIEDHDGVQKCHNHVTGFLCREIMAALRRYSDRIDVFLEQSRPMT